MGENKDNKITDTLLKLSESRMKDIDYYIDIFKEIYKGDYRHKYSEILRFLINLNEEYRDYLSYNITILYEKINSPSKNHEFKSQFNKLYDHISLEAIRLAKYKAFEDKENMLSSKIESFNMKFIDSQSKLDKLNDKIVESTKKVDSTQTSFVSILGIFSSIIFTLFGGLNILSQTFSKVQDLTNEKHFWGVIIISMIVIFAVFNFLTLLLYSIGKFIDRTIISRQCQKSCMNEYCNCILVKKMFKKYPHITIPNIVIIFAIVCISIRYFLI